MQREARIRTRGLPIVDRGLRPIALRVRDVRSAAEATRAAGVPLLGEARTHRDGSHSFSWADPDGNPVPVLFATKISPQL